MTRRPSPPAGPSRWRPFAMHGVSPRRRHAAYALAVAALALLWAPAGAAPVGILDSADLTSQQYATGPVVEPFDYPPGTSLAGQRDRCGNTWTVVGGSIVVNDDSVAVAATSGLVTATVPLCNSASVNAESGGDIHSTGSSSFGMLLHAAPGGRPSTAAVYSNQGAGTLRLQRINANGTVTTWATATGTGGGNIPRFLRLEYVNGTYRASVNNVVALTYVVPTPQVRAAVEANTEAGIVAFSDTRSTFDNFQAYPR